MVIAERRTSVESKPKPKLSNTGIVFERPKQYSRLAVAENSLASINKDTWGKEKIPTLKQVEEIVDLKVMVRSLTRRAVGTREISGYRKKAEIKLLKRIQRRLPRDRQIKDKIRQSRGKSL